jgi:hypothetical protein
VRVLGVVVRSFRFQERVRDALHECPDAAVALVPASSGVQALTVGLGGELLRAHRCLRDAIDAELGDPAFFVLVGVEAVGALDVAAPEGLDQPLADGVRLEAVVEDFDPPALVISAAQGVDHLRVFGRITSGVEGGIDPVTVREPERLFGERLAQLLGRPVGCSGDVVATETITAPKKTRAQ